MDIALCLDRLVPEADWQGSVTANTKEAFDAIRWNDDRKKPTWKAVQAKWTEIEAEPVILKREALTEIDELKARVETLETENLTRG